MRNTSLPDNARQGAALCLGMRWFCQLGNNKRERERNSERKRKTWKGVEGKKHKNNLRRVPHANH